MLTDEYRYKVLKLLDDNPELTQRQLAKSLGISLGKVNYCLKALIEKGMIKASNFRNSQNKQAYAYLLTRRGIEAKTRLTAEFLKIKIAEHQALKREIEELRRQVSLNSGKVAESSKDNSVSLSHDTSDVEV
ncbi:MarR family EPS-associated transcriptional regulator [Marinimicrobium sp. LS-A18]|uniref:MarR family EPS-associated transcriptional regulator n=1 Tax=Marinimicrobium sp. LS-A18 TaxID=1381596 RepID=UPI0004678D12|nr:MarR family EPS-associated transcriptional regulator [Marinimicrobium sp. LS-A18]